MKTRVSLLISAALLCFVLISFARAEDTYEVYRLFQMDKVGSGGSVRSLGSRKTGLNAPAGKFVSTSNETGLLGALGSRYVAFFTLSELLRQSEPESTTGPLPFFMNIIEKPEIVGVIIILPPATKLHTALSSREQQQFKMFERALISESVDKPVYFAFETEELKKIYNSLNNENVDENLFTTSNFQLLVNEKEATIISPITAVNIQGFLRGESVVQDASNLPTIAIVANYDTWSIIPELAASSEASSGVIAALEIARLFNLLYLSPQTRAKYNFIFVLTSGGRAGYEGSRQWIKKLDEKVLDNIVFALALESIGSENLHLHISQKTKDENVIRLYKEFQTTAAMMNISFEVIYKQHDIGREPSWEHEVFVQKKLEAATLSKHGKPISQFQRSSLLDASTNQTILERNIKFVAESLARFVYNIPKSIEIFNEGTLSINSKFVESWKKTLDQYPRCAAFLSKDSSVVESMRTTLAQFTNQTAAQEFELKSVYKFYGGQKANLTLYKVKPFSFELLLMAPVAVYLLLLHIYISGLSTVVNGVRGMFKPATKKK